MIIGSKATNPGELRIPARFYSREISTQAGGFQKPDVTELIDEAWVKWTNVHGSEAWIANSVQAEAGATVLRRYREGIDATCVIEKGGEYFEIVSLDNIGERGEYLELKVKLWRPG